MIQWTPFDIAFDGTSLTNRMVSGFWQDALEDRLRLLSARPLRFYDLGTPGGTLASTAATTGTINRMRPAAIVIEYGMNEATGKLSLATFKLQLEARIAGYRSAAPSARVVLMTMNPAIPPATTSGVGQYYAVMRSVAAALQLPMIDCEPVWGAPTIEQIPDGVHPTRAANLAVTVPTALAALTPLVQA